jgi:hypothetical protein
MENKCRPAPPIHFPNAKNAIRAVEATTTIKSKMISAENDPI